MDNKTNDLLKNPILDPIMYQFNPFQTPHHTF